MIDEAFVKRLREASEEIKRGVHSPGHMALMNKAADILESFESRDVKIDTTDEREFRDYCCPRCGVTICQELKAPVSPFHVAPLYKPNFCVDCGQALVWPVRYIEPANHE